MLKKRIISGIQPTNKLTLGNYLGAIKQFIDLQNTYEMYIFVADLHAISVPYDKKQLPHNKLNLVACYQALGLDIEKCTIFYQSDVITHTALSWILTCNSTIGELNRMTQFKDKSAKLKMSNQTETIPGGLLMYPILMAADILLYDADHVPTGIDQKQHIELARNIAIRMNNKYGDLFKVCEPLFPGVGAKIMDLLDPTIKMSKSNANENGTIFLLDEPEMAIKKIMGAKTDALNKIVYDIQNQPGISNLLTIYSCLKNSSIETIVRQYQGRNYGEFKKDLASVVNNFLVNFQKKYKVVIKNSDTLKSQLAKNAAKCLKITNKKLQKIYKAIGLI